jgi:hypothetical protein
VGRGEFPGALLGPVDKLQCCHPSLMIHCAGLQHCGELVQLVHMARHVLDFEGLMKKPLQLFSQLLSEVLHQTSVPPNSMPDNENVNLSQMKE